MATSVPGLRALQLDQERHDSYVDALLGRSSPGTRTVGEIAADVNEYERLHAASGAPSIPQAALGAGRAVLDVLSRPNYAVAGFVEELWRGKGLDDALHRATSELLSGLGALHGQKRAFAEVFESAGMPALGALSQLFPFLYNETGEGVRLQRGGALDPTGRGALGLTADIVLDPLLPLTLGTTGVARAGTRVLSNAGLRMRESLSRLPRLANGALDLARAPIEVRAAAERAQKARTLFGRELTDLEMNDILAGRTTLIPQPLPGQEAIVGTPAGLTIKRVKLHSPGQPIGNIVSVQEGTSEALVAYNASVEYADKRVLAAIEAGATNLLDRGGLKYFGHTIVPSPIQALRDSGIAGNVMDRIAALSKSHPVVASALDSTARFKRAVLDPLGRTFNVAWDARNVREFMRSRQAHLNVNASLKSQWARHLDDSAMANWERSHSLDELKDFYRAYERGGPALVATKFAGDPSAKDAADWIERSARLIRESEHRFGIGSHRRQWYIPHFYENTHDAIDSVVRESRLGRQPVALGRLTTHNEERTFDFIDEAVAFSERKSRVSPQLQTLKPVWSVTESFRRRGFHSIDVIQWRGFTRDLVERFGAGAIPTRVDRLFDLSRTYNPTPNDVHVIDQWFRSTARPVATAAAKPTRAATKSMINSLTDEGKREYFHRLFLSVNRRQDLLAVREHFTDQFEQFFPTHRPLAGELDLWNERFSPFAFGVPGVRTQMIPSSIARSLADMRTSMIRSEEMNLLARGFSRATNLWKSSVTVWWPAFHFRNAYSNVAQSFLDIGISALDPRLHYQAIRTLLARSSAKLRAETVEFGGRTYTRGQLLDMMTNRGALQGVSYLEYTGPRVGQFTARGKVASTLKNANPAEYGRKLGGAIEDEARAMLFFGNLRRGLSSDEAAERVNKFLFDYQNGLTEVERRWFRTAMPFYTWTSKNVRLMSESILARPGRIITPAKPLRGRTDENERLVKWEADDLKLRLNGDGRSVQVLSGIDLPISNMDTLWSGTAQRTFQQLAGQISPLIRAPFEVITGVNLFLGRRMDRKESALIGRFVEVLPGPIKDWMGWAKGFDAEGRPRYTFDATRFYLLTNAMLANRVASTGDRQFREWLDKSPSSWLGALHHSALNILTGIRYDDVQFHREMRRRLQERERELRSALIKRGVLVRFEKAVAPSRRPQLD